LPDFQGKSSQIAIFGSDLLWVVTNPLISWTLFPGVPPPGQFCDIKELAIFSL
jgi:hypothetical protein